MLLETEQLGKVNSLRRVIGASDEPYLTITDGDVMFLKGWDSHISKVFTNFPRATVVSPVPNFKTFNQFTSNIWLEQLWTGNLKFEQSADPDGLEKFAKSIGWPHLNKSQKDVILTITKKKFKATVGCGHFCATYKREALLFAPNESSEFVLSGNSEEVYLDIPTTKNDGYRLSTHKNHAYHLGNTWEEWMHEELCSLEAVEPEKISWPIFNRMSAKPIKYWIKFNIFKRLLSKKRVYNYSLNRFKVPQDYKEHYLK